MGIDFIDSFEKFVYANTYIYNLVNYFSKYIYPNFTLDIVGDNIISSFD